RAPVIAGAGSNDTRKAVELVRVARQSGAQAALVVTPYYNKPSQAALIAHFAAVADASDLPIVLYDVPSRTGVTMAVDTVAAIAERSTVIGIKDAVGDMVRPTLMRAACGPDFILLSGDDPSALGYMAHGGRGCISVTSNVTPKACADFQNACLAGDFAAARREHERLIDLHRALFFDASPAPAKFALSELGLCTDEVRPPLLPCAEAVRPRVAAALRRAEAAG
ncbi:MAG: 4-hydroxy-tetrahydrodipicolinate synthase, partial [Pseudomonadota bacterium]|nr:4-hydroxy-tetrahydrodipicolinate synthase [Pseudomonadota bacterium]